MVDVLLSNPRMFTKAPGDNQCNICERSTSLTEDHVPPRSCLVDRRFKIERYFNTTQRRSIRPALSQNGIRYKTICGPCNNEILGAQSDPALADLASAVRARMQSVLALPPRVYCQPAIVLRSICGHLLAAKTKIDAFDMDRDLRPFVLDPVATMPTRWRVFYWMYPHRHVAVVRDVAMPSVRGRLQSQPGLFSILKFFPLGFLVTDLRSYEGLPCLNDFVTRGGTTRTAIPFSAALGRSLRWPEECAPGNYVMGGPALDDSFGATFAPKGT